MTTTTKTLNWILGLIGLAIIWFATESIVGVLGGLVAGIHITINGK